MSTKSRDMFKRLRDLLSPNRPWLYLLYLGLFFFRWIYQPPGLLEAGLSLIAMAGFIALYVFGLRRMDWTVPLAAALCTALGFAFVPINMGGAVYVAFAAAMLGRWPDGRQRLIMLISLAVIATSLSFWLGMPLYFLAAMLLFSGLAAGGSAMSARRERDDAQAEERQSQAALLGAEAERQRIARDLHDLLGHTLSVVALKADLANRLYESDPDRARAELSEIQTISRDALSEVREAVTGLRDRDLAGAIAEARARLETAGLEVRTDLPADLDLDPAVSAALAMTVREAATNILRHAEAKRVAIRVDQSDSQIGLQVEDNGRGGAEIAGGGLSGLAQRLEEAGGRLEVNARSDGRGTCLSALLPLTEAGHA